MKLKLIQLLLAMMLLWPAAQAEAAGSCTTSGVASLGFSNTYDPSAALTNTTTASLDVTCTKAGNNTVNYTVAANDGIYFSGTQNQAASGANRIKYDVYTNNTCVTQWTGATTIAGLDVVSGTNIQPLPYYGCIPAGQWVPAGTYTDTVTMTLGGGAAGTATFPVTITVSAVCGLTPAPGTVAFTYTSFQGGASTASTTFSVTCNSSLPYTMALDATSGTLPATNLAYTLALSAASGTGSGVAQSYTINGNMAGGQSGTCALASCLDTQARTLTITY